MQNNNYFFDDITRLRGFACFIILIHHIAWIVPIKFIYNIVPYYLLAGDGGVFIFFAISGFVVTLSLKNKIEELKGTNFIERVDSARDMIVSFYKRRFFRLFPVLAFTILITALYMCVYTNETDWMRCLFRAPIEVVFGNFNYTIKVYEMTQHVYRNAIGPMWTMGVESQFYLLWPFILLMFKNNNQRALLSFITGCFILFVMQPTCYALWGFDYYSTYGVLPSLFLGAFMAFIYKEEAGQKMNVKVAQLISAVLAMSIWFYTNAVDQAFFGRICIHIMVAFLIALVVFVKGSFNFPILGRMFNYIGTRSYSIYILTLPLASWIVWFTNSIYFSRESMSDYDFYRYQLLIFIVVIFVVSEIVYRCIEKPLRTFGRR